MRPLSTGAHRWCRRRRPRYPLSRYRSCRRIHGLGAECDDGNIDRGFRLVSTPTVPVGLTIVVSWGRRSARQSVAVQYRAVVVFTVVVRVGVHVTIWRRCRAQRERDQEPRRHQPTKELHEALILVPGVP